MAEEVEAVMTSVLKKGQVFDDVRSTRTSVAYMIGGLKNKESGRNFRGKVDARSPNVKADGKTGVEYFVMTKCMHG